MRSPGRRPITLVRLRVLAEGALDQVRVPAPLPVLFWESQVHGQAREVLGKASDRARIGTLPLGAGSRPSACAASPATALSPGGSSILSKISHQPDLEARLVGHSAPSRRRFEVDLAPVIAVDLNHGHLAVCVLDPSGNPIGAPVTVPLELTGLPASTRDGRIRRAISEVLALAARAWRRGGRDRGPRLRRPARGGSGAIRAPPLTGQARQDLPPPRRRTPDREVPGPARPDGDEQRVAVIAVDPAYTSRWGAEHWLDPLQQISPEASGHHAAAVVIERRGLGHRARRRERYDSTRAVHRDKRAADSVVSVDRRPHTEPEDRKAGGQARRDRGPSLANEHPPATRRPRTVRGHRRAGLSVLLSVQER